MADEPEPAKMEDNHQKGTKRYPLINILFIAIPVLLGFLGYISFVEIEDNAEIIEMDETSVAEGQADEHVKIFAYLVSDEQVIISGKTKQGKYVDRWSGQINNFSLRDTTGQINVTFTQDEVRVFDTPHNVNGKEQFWHRDVAWVVGKVEYRNGEKVLVMEAISGTEYGFAYPKMGRLFVFFGCFFFGVMIGGGVWRIASTKRPYNQKEVKAAGWEWQNLSLFQLTIVWALFCAIGFAGLIPALFTSHFWYWKTQTILFGVMAIILLIFVIYLGRQLYVSPKYMHHETIKGSLDKSKFNETLKKYFILWSEQNCRLRTRIYLTANKETVVILKLLLLDDLNTNFSLTNLKEAFEKTVMELELEVVKAEAVSGN